MRQLINFLAVAAIAYGALLALVFVWQPRMLYLPNIAGPGLIATPAAIGLAFEDVRFATSDGLTLHGWLAPAADAGAVVLHCHGNGGNISHRLEMLRLLHDLGLSVLLFDYRGYGLSEGRPTEDGTYRDAEAAWRFLVGERGYAPRNVILFGHSLGAAVAAHLAQHVQAGAVILESPFTSAPELASVHYWFLPARRLTRFQYATAQYVRNVHAPLLVIHSPQDEIVPIEHGREVFRNAREPKVFLETLGDHNEGFVLSGERYTSGLRRFIAQHVTPRGVR